MTSPAPTSTPLVPGGGLLTLHLLDGGHPAAIVLGGKVASPGLSTDDVEMWRDEAWGAFRGAIVGGTLCTGATYRRLDVANGLPIEVPAPGTPAGLHGVPRALAAACTLIKWHTAAGGRSGKGRTFLPGIAATNVQDDGRTYTTAHRTYMVGVINAYLGSTEMAAAGIQPAVVSRTRGEAFPILGGAVSTIVGVQRRRMRA